MTDPRLLADGFFVCPFVPPEGLAELASDFRMIINNRPDNEEPGQPGSAEINAEASRLDLDYVHVPVVPGRFEEEQLAAFIDALDSRKGPVLAFCKTGRRSASLWALAEARSGKRSTREILAAAAAAGHDLSALAPALEIARQA